MNKTSHLEETTSATYIVIHEEDNIENGFLTFLSTKIEKNYKNMEVMLFFNFHTVFIRKISLLKIYLEKYYF